MVVRFFKGRFVRPADCAQAFGREEKRKYFLFVFPGLRTDDHPITRNQEKPRAMGAPNAVLSVLRPGLNNSAAFGAGLSLAVRCHEKIDDPR
jgi:hypothetical protein